MSRKRAAEALSTRIDLSEETLGNREGEAMGMAKEAVLTLARPSAMLPPTLPVLPVSERPFFPGQTMTLTVPEDPWLETVEKVGETPHKLFALLLTRNEGSVRPALEDFYAVGTVVRMHKPKRHEGRIQFVAEGVARFDVQDWNSGEPPFLAEVAYPTLPSEDANGIKAYSTAIIDTVKELVPLNPLYGEELEGFLARFRPSDPAPFADFAANLTTASKDELQDVLETTQLTRRMEKVLVLLKTELAVAKLQTRIRKVVEERMTDQPLTSFLKQQLKAIREEGLGISKTIAPRSSSATAPSSRAWRRPSPSVNDSSRRWASSPRGVADRPSTQ